MVEAGRGSLAWVVGELGLVWGVDSSDGSCEGVDCVICVGLRTPLLEREGGDGVGGMIEEEGGVDEGVFEEVVDGEA